MVIVAIMSPQLSESAMGRHPPEGLRAAGLPSRGVALPDCFFFAATPSLGAARRRPSLRGAAVLPD
eukprot:CAMPEP_0179371270 /NCGR_PEP_ID=MMETSP0797-20121207/85634_1 /TAXON_ID=47934 /ORGANISM="Dinophysis acuminata, Strain DAEP01" /LENGTH=65 /DNA_ID=CAMNT_0021087107 /DNA_START=15 /DNA_END=212 /DNA_ORIENTATION=-